MQSSLKIPRWLWYKRYFETGLGITSFMKYVLAIFGAFSVGIKLNLVWTAILGILYLLSCFIVGYWWIESKILEKENEINNLLNPFQVEVREAIKKKKFKYKH